MVELTERLKINTIQDLILIEQRGARSKDNLIKIVPYNALVQLNPSKNKMDHYAFGTVYCNFHLQKRERTKEKGKALKMDTTKV